VISRRRIERRGDGARLRLPKEERQLLRELVANLEARLSDETGDDDLRRLFPPAYDTAPDDEAEYRRLQRGELVDGHRQALRVVESTIERDQLTGEELDAWLKALNELRLVLGTGLDITEESYMRWPDPRDPDARERALYLYLSALQEEAVAAASRGRFS
jgi:uncharacterized protein DUF2017